MKERKRKHDDIHYPMQGRGKRATPPKPKRGATGPMCAGCGKFPAGSTHLCNESNYVAEDADREMGLDRPWKE